MTRPAYFVGIDLHKTVIQICVLDREGEIACETRFGGRFLEDGLRVVTFLRRRFRDARVAVEAIGMNRWLVNALGGAGFDVLVVDPAKLNLRMLGKKTDRRDAYEIARRLRLGDLDRNATTYYPSEGTYGVRKLLRVRHKLISIRQQVVNQIRGMQNAYRVPAPRGALYRKRALALLRELRVFEENQQLCFDVLVQELASVQAQIELLSKRIKQVAKAPAVAAAEGMLPGVGPQTATTLIAELGDVSRFRNTRAVASYAGLAPRVANSADRSHHGSITKRGNRELRWILSEWAVRLLAKDRRVQSWAAPRLRRMHKNKVRMALARRLLVGTYIMLSRGEVFSLERCLAA
jgi:transposase